MRGRTNAAAAGGGVKTAKVSFSYNRTPRENICYVSSSGSITKRTTVQSLSFSITVVVPSMLVFDYGYGNDYVNGNPSKFNGVEAQTYFENYEGNSSYRRTDFILVEDDMSLSITKS